MQKNSPFYVETHLGKLQISKGAYLTLQKRKSSTFRTLAKTKIIIKECTKATVKRSLRKNKYQKNSTHEVWMIDRMGESVNFKLEQESTRLKSKMIGSLPSIQMAYDNDAQSQWGEIDGCVSNLSLSLSLAVFDNSFKDS